MDWVKRLLFILTFFGSTLSQAEEIEERFEHYTTQGGLSQNHVKSIFQDKVGYIWLATFNGLNRFDGYEFKVFNFNNSDTTTISQSNINIIYQDRSGTIWVGTEFGLNRYNPINDSFQRFYKLNAESKPSSDNNIRTIYEDESGLLWLGFYGGDMMRFNPKTEQFLPIPELNKYMNQLNINKVNSFYVDSKGFYWIGTEAGGLIQYQPFTHSIQSFTTKSIGSKKLADDIVMSIAEDQFGYIWVGTWMGGIDKIDSHLGVIDHLDVNNSELVSNSITALHFDSHEVLWVGTFDKGAMAINITSKNVVNYKYDTENPIGINHDIVWNIFEDRDGVIWFGTFGGGLNKLTREKNRLTLFKAEKGRDNWLNNSYITSCCETSKNKLLIGTFGGGINILNHERNRFEYLLNDSVGSAKTIRAIYEDTDKNIWISTDKAVYFFDANFKLKHQFQLNSAPNGIGINTIFSILQDDEGNFWFGLWSHGIKKLAKSELNKMDSESIVFQQIDEPQFNHHTIWTLYEDTYKTIWIGANNSLFRYDRLTKKFIDVFNDGVDDKEMKSTPISCFYQDLKHNKLWFGTYGEGFGCYSYDTKSIEFIPNLYIESKTAFAIHADSKDNLWICINTGLLQYNIKQKSFRNFNFGLDNAHSNIFYNAWMLKSEEIVIASNSGFYLFNPNAIDENVNASPIIISDLEILNKSVYELPSVNKILSEELNSAAELMLSEDFNVIAFQFSVLDFRHPLQNRYQYMLEGYDKEWITVDPSHRKASYSNLASGRYTLKYRGCNSSGIWNPYPKELKIGIIPPFIRSWGFKIIIFLILSLVLAYLIRLKYGAVSNKIRSTIVDLNYRKLEEDLSKTNNLYNELEGELDEKSRELATLRLFIQQREDNLLSLKNLFSALSNGSGFITKAKYTEILQILEKELKEQNGWDSFKENLDVLQNEFLKKLAINHPKLTQKDLLVCAYIKLAKSNKDIANLLNISVQSVEMTRYRIRKKMDLNSKISLNDYFARF